MKFPEASELKGIDDVISKSLNHQQFVGVSGNRNFAKFMAAYDCIYLGQSADLALSPNPNPAEPLLPLNGGDLFLLSGSVEPKLRCEDLVPVGRPEDESVAARELWHRFLGGLLRAIIERSYDSGDKGNHG